ncbi:MAG: hypothetical protein KDA73_08990 [Rhodobacteraceae bacterium]|nr:hypothetical protein [Paracoccaceae bacterium]
MTRRNLLQNGARRRLSARSFVPAAMVLTIAACAPKGFPEDPLFSPVGKLPEPAIEPTQPILDAGARAAEEDLTGQARSELEERGTDLRKRADALRKAEP